MGFATSATPLIVCAPRIGCVRWLVKNAEQTTVLVALPLAYEMEVHLPKDGRNEAPIVGCLCGINIKVRGLWVFLNYQCQMADA